MSTRSGTLDHIPALDGIRGLAILAVVAFHLGYLPGGYLGVDAFFVLSGYLITSLLLAERVRSARTNLGRFYLRRARRLLPAVLVLLAAVGIWGARWAYPQELESLRAESLGALFYVANWQAIVSANAYWDLEAAPGPLDHMWSLAIEEQFYLAWPVVFLALWRLARGRAGVIAAFAGGLALVSASAMAVLFEPGGDVNRVYLGTDTRAQAILIGAGCAALLHVRAPGRAGGRALTRLAWVAVALLGVAWWRVGGDTDALYRGGFTLHAVAVAVVIAAARLGGGLGAALSWAPLRWCGWISYSWYLWHWPMIVWLTPERVGFSGAALEAVQVSAGLAAAVASYGLVERPVRFGAWVTPRRVLVGVPVAMAVVALALVVWTKPLTVDLEQVAVPPPPEPVATEPAPAPAADRAASVDPSVVASRVAELATRTTATPPPPPESPVVLEPGEALRVIYTGDSIGAQVYPYLARALGDDVELMDLTGVASALCDWLPALREHRGWEPHVVIVDHGGNALTPCMQDEQGERYRGEAYRAKYQRDADEVVAIAEAVGARVLFVDQPVSREGRRSGTHEIFLAMPERYPGGSVAFMSTWPALSPGGEFVQSDSCNDDEPGCIDGHGEIRSRPPGNHLEPLGRWRYALAIRDRLAELAWLGVDEVSDPNGTAQP